MFELDKFPDRIEGAWSILTVKQRYLYALIAVLILALVLVVLREPEPEASAGVSVPAKPAPEVKKTPKQATPIKAKTVKTYPAAVKNKLKLPDPVQLDPAEAVVAASQVQADDHPHTVTTTLNLDTGETETYVKRDPLPWLAWDYRGEAGISLGLKDGEPTTRLEARQNLFQVKAVHFGVTGSVDQALNGERDADWYLGIGAWYRW